MYMYVDMLYVLNYENTCESQHENAHTDIKRLQCEG